MASCWGGVLNKDIKVCVGLCRGLRVRMIPFVALFFFWLWIFFYILFFLNIKGGDSQPCYPSVACCLGSSIVPLWMECILGRKREDWHCVRIVHAGPAQSVSFDGFEITAEPPFLFLKGGKEANPSASEGLWRKRFPFFVPDGAADVIEMRRETGKKTKKLLSLHFNDSATFTRAAPLFFVQCKTLSCCGIQQHVLRLCVHCKSSAVMVAFGLSLKRTNDPSPLFWALTTVAMSNVSVGRS